MNLTYEIKSPETLSIKICNGILEIKCDNNISVCDANLYMTYTLEQKNEMAQNPNTSASTLEILANDKNKYTRYWVARNLNTPAFILEMLAKDDHEYVRRGVAWNPNTPASILEVLAKDDHEDVKCGVAWNPNTPVSILEILAKDKDKDTRYWVARNPNTPASILKILAKDEDRYVRRGVARNPDVKKLKVRYLITSEGKKYFENKRQIAKLFHLHSDTVFWGLKRGFAEKNISILKYTNITSHFEEGRHYIKIDR